MKKITTLLFALTFVSLCSLFAQDKKLPVVTIKNLNGEKVSTETISNDGQPLIVSFWATWCKPCILELSTIHDEYEDWQDETGVKLVAISVDDARNSSKVKPFIDGRGWEYEVYIDENGDLKRALGVNNVPHTFLLDGEGKIVWQHSSYSPGDEEELYEEVEKLVNKK